MRQLVLRPGGGDVRCPRLRKPPPLPSADARLPLTGLPVTPVMLVGCALLGALIAAATIGRRDRSWEEAFGVLLCNSVVAAPKNSLWNFTPLILVFVNCWALGPRRPWAHAILAMAWSLIGGGVLAEASAGLLAGHPLAQAWLSSAPLYGGLLLLGLVVKRLFAAAPGAPYCLNAAERGRNLSPIHRPFR
jgi:hypothetical protein